MKKTTERESGHDSHVGRYLLALCVAAPTACAPELATAVSAAITGQPLQAGACGTPVAIELGSGVGAPSVAFALSLLGNHGDSLDTNQGTASEKQCALVLATDTAPHALALSTSNAAANGLQEGRLVAEELDHNDISAVQATRHRWQAESDHEHRATDTRSATLARQRAQKARCWHEGTGHSADVANTPT